MDFPTQQRDTTTAWGERRLTSLISETFTKKFTQDQFPMSPRPTQWGIELTCSAKHSWFLCEILGGCCGPPIVATFLSCPFATQGSSFFESSTIILGQTNTKRITWGNDDRGTLWHSRVTWPSGGWRLQPPVWWDTQKVLLITSHLARSCLVAALSRITPPAAWSPLPTSPSPAECRPVSTF